MSNISLLILFASTHTTVYLSILDCTVIDTLDTRGDSDIADICSIVNSSPIVRAFEVLALLCETSFPICVPFSSNTLQINISIAADPLSVH